MASGVTEPRRLVEAYQLRDGRTVHILAQGRLVNLAAAEGHPAAVMDMSFANQALCAAYVARHHAELEPRVYDVPEEIDREVAALKLRSMGIEIDCSPRSRSTIWPRGNRARPERGAVPFPEHADD